MSAPLCILLVDDSNFFLTLEKQFLKKVPVAVLEARSAEQAMSLCRERVPDLIFMAYDLRDMDGASCCRQFKSDPALNSVPVILICEENAPEQIEACRKAGSGGVLTKPLDRHKFMETGRQFLSGIREHRQPCLFQVSFRLGGECFSGKCLDLSNGGLFLESPNQPTPGEAVALEFVLPGQPPVSIEASGKVAWLNSKADPLKPNYPLGFGVKFMGISEKSIKSIREFLKRRGNP